MPTLTNEHVKRVLVVDDEPAFVSGLCETIEDDGFKAVGALSGMEALKKLGEEAIDLIILDLRIPRMDGYEILEKVRHNPATKHIPVIIVTAVTETTSIFRAKELGSNDYFIKPFDTKKLLQKIKTFI